MLSCACDQVSERASSPVADVADSFAAIAGDCKFGVSCGIPGRGSVVAIRARRTAVLFSRVCMGEGSEAVSRPYEHALAEPSQTSTSRMP